MKTPKQLTVVWAMAAMVTGMSGVSVGAEAQQVVLEAAASTHRMTPRVPQHATAPIPATEPSVPAANVAAAGFASTSAFSAASPSAAPNATTLSPPVTITYSGSSNALTVTDSGTGRGISSTVSNSNSGSSALFGTTVGTGAGLTGYNSGTSGPGGKFEVTNASSAQAGAFASTNGTGPALLGTVTNSNSNYPALFGQNLVGEYGIGVQGNGYYGVYGTSEAQYGFGLFGYGNGTDGVGIQGYAPQTGGHGVNGVSQSGTGVYASVNQGTPGTGAAGLHATDSSNANADSYGIYANSLNNTAAYFQGGSSGSGYCSFSGGTGWNCSSDKNLKQDFVPVDGMALLERLAALPLFEYSMKGERAATRYVGPTAQDFMSAFHLGDDDTLINTANAQGVALAAAKGLYEKLKRDETEIDALKQQLADSEKNLAVSFSQKDAQIAELKAQLVGQSAAQAQILVTLADKFSARIAALEQQREFGPQTAGLTAPSNSVLRDPRSSGLK